MWAPSYCLSICLFLSSLSWWSLAHPLKLPWTWWPFTATEQWLRTLEPGVGEYSFVTSWTRKDYLFSPFVSLCGWCACKCMCVCLCGVLVCMCAVCLWEHETWCSESFSTAPPRFSFEAGSLNQTQSLQIPLAAVICFFQGCTCLPPKVEITDKPSHTTRHFYRF